MNHKDALYELEDLANKMEFAISNLSVIQTSIDEEIVYINDENGNPNGRDGFQYFDSEINLQAYYEEKRNAFQTKTVTGEDGNEQTVTTGIRKWTVKVSECKYIYVENPADIFARVRG